VKALKRRLLLSIAALSPGVVVIALQEFAVSMAFLLLGLFGALGVAAAALAMSPQIKPTQVGNGAIKTDYPSLLVPSAKLALVDKTPDVVVIRANLATVMAPSLKPPDFLTQDEQIAMVLSRIMARWGQSEIFNLSDDQARELWLIDRLLRASPAEAGAMAVHFASPNAVLAMRDSIAAPTPA